MPLLVRCFLQSLLDLKRDAIQSFLTQLLDAVVPVLVQQSHCRHGVANASFKVSSSPMSLQLPLHCFVGQALREILALHGYVPFVWAKYLPLKCYEWFDGTARLI